MSLMLAPRFAADPVIEAEWLGIESRLERLEAGIRDWRTSLGLPGTEPHEDFSDRADALLPASGEESREDTGVRDGRISPGLPETAPRQASSETATPLPPDSDEESRGAVAFSAGLAAVAAPLRSALTRISALIDRAAQTTLTPRQLEELGERVGDLALWPRGEPAFAQARKLSADVFASGILASPSKRPTLPEQILSECQLLAGYLDRGT